MRWKVLKKGDVIDVVAPATHSPMENLNLGRDWLISLGYIPRVPADLISPDVFFAATLEQQFEHLKESIYSDSKAIWCLRGGYGSMRLVPYLKKLKAPKTPKLFVGFSDITALHIFFNQYWNWPTLHGKTLSQLAPDLKTPDVKELKKIITGELKERTFKKLRPLNEAARVSKVIKGKMIGGNLRILQSSLGTDWELKAKGKFLFLEDVSERGYSIDRMLEQLHQAKIIDRGLKGIILGDFSGGDEQDGSNLIQTALERFAQRVDYPVLAGLPSGHETTLNHAIPFNTPCVLTTGRRPQFTCQF